MQLKKYDSVNFIGDIFHPHYSGREVYIATHKIKRNKDPIKLRFSKVHDTSEYAGDWYLDPKKARRCRTTFDNNGMKCYVIPWSAFEPLTINERDWREIL